MINLTTRSDRNRLDLTVADPLAPTDLVGLADRVRAESKGLKDGWMAAIDLSGLTVGPGLDGHINDIQVALRDGGAAKIGTLVTSAILKAKLSREGKTAHLEGNVQRFDDRAAWRRFVGN
jgi:hypothetical protein